MLFVVNAQRGKDRRKLHQLHGRSLLRIGCHMTINYRYLNDDSHLLSNVQLLERSGQGPEIMPY